MLSEPILQGRNGVEHRRARPPGEGFDERRVGRRKQFRSVGINKTFDLAIEESSFKQRVKDRLLRNQFIPHRIANRLRQTLPVPRNHPLRPDRDAE